MTPKLHNDLRFYMLSIHESAELAESKAQEVENMFNQLDKYDQLDISHTLTISGWETAIDEMYNLCGSV